MKSNTNLRSMLVVVMLVGALAFTVVAVGCFGGDDDAGDVSGTITTATGIGATSTSDTTTVVAGFDPLSSFKSKDPFIPQAQATTTLAPPSTTPTTLPPTTIGVTTTAPHKLTVTAFPGGGFVAFTINNDSFTSFEAGPALLAGAWGTIQILSVDDGGAPFSATFRRNGTVDFTLELGESKIW